MKFNTIYQIYIDFKQFILKVKYEIALNNFTTMFYEFAAIIIRHNKRLGPFHALFCASFCTPFGVALLSQDFFVSFLYSNMVVLC